MLSDDICSNCENKFSGCRREVEWYNSTPICRSFVERQAHISESEFDKMQKEAADLRAELAALKEKYRWRDADKELPKTSMPVLIISPDDIPHAVMFYAYTRKFTDFMKVLNDVEYWMPLKMPGED